MLKKTTFREIKGSLGRYFAILLIIALGAGFFCGLKVTTPALVKTANSFFTSQNLYDFTFISTLGYEEKDIERILEKKNIRQAEGTVSIDVLCEGEDSDVVRKALTIPEKINKVYLKEGRLPEKSGECLADARIFSKDDIGTYISLSENNEKDTLDMFSKKKYEIVGTCVSPLYVNYERGSTSLGNGTIDSFFYLLPKGFDVDYFTEIYVDLEGNEEIYSKAYKERIKASEDDMESLAKKVSHERYQRIYDKAKKKIDDAQKEYQDGCDTYMEERNKAYGELADARVELTDGEQEVRDGKKEISDNEEKIEKNEEKIEKNEEKLEKSEEALLKNEKELKKNEKEIAENEATLKENQKKLASQKEELEKNKEKVDGGLLQVEGGIAELEKGRAYMDQTTYDAQLGALKKQKETLLKNKSQIEKGLESIEEGEKKIAEGLKKLENGKEEIKKGKEEIAKGKKEITEGKKELEKGKAKLADGKAEITDGKKEIKDAEDEIQRGWNEYYDGKAEADKEFADAWADLEDGRKKISDAREKLEDIEKPDTYVLTRSSNIGYACFENDSDIVDQVAKLFPLFFFLVAALVCMTTMTRMIDENRTQIGVMLALGYRPIQVMGKYIFYSGSAGILGTIVGFIGCSIVFPLIIWNAYQMMYEFPNPLEYVFDIPLGIASLIAALVCCVGTTIVCGMKDFRETPSQLIRPKAPAAGKRILLERWGFFWNRLSFLYKVSIRNIFRYKKRFFMMVLGIAGCTALLLTGFGASDSIKKVADFQYDEITLYDYGAYFDEDASKKDKEKFSKSSKIESLIFVDEIPVKYDAAGSDKEFTMIVSDGKDFNQYVNLHFDGKELQFPKDGTCTVCENIAEQNGLAIGDELVLRDEDEKEFHVKIGGVCKNYVGSYIFINDKTYETVMGRKASLDTAYVMAKGDSEKEIYASAAKAWEQSYIAGTSVNLDMKKRIFSLIDNLDAVIALVVAAAGALCFIVLYNLTNINIRERIREIATLKVLGFYPRETSSYVFRENIMMTGISAVLGLGLGKILHAVIISMIKVDFISFEIRIEPMSYVYAVVLTFVFAALVNVVMYFRLQKISMIESLKSVE